MSLIVLLLIALLIIIVATIIYCRSISTKETAVDSKDVPPTASTAELPTKQTLPTEKSTDKEIEAHEPSIKTVRSDDDLSAKNSVHTTANQRSGTV